MKRRVFLWTGLAALCAGAGVLPLLSSDQAAVVKVLRKKLAYLTLDESGVRRFARDFIPHHVVSTQKLRAIDAAGPLYTRIGWSAKRRLGGALAHGEDRIVTLYLMSSDFFKNGADKGRVVHYLGFYDPVAACNNPFARPATGSEVSGSQLG
jgi:hypothetical protein